MSRTTINLKLRIMATLCISLLALPEAESQNDSFSGKDTVSKYIDCLVVKLNAEKSLVFRYQGKLTPVPAELDAPLASAFPKHKSKVAVVEYSHYQWYPARVLIVQDAADGRVLAHCGDIFVLGGQGSLSFKEFLSSHQAASEKDALGKVGLLAEVIVFPNWRVGKVSMKNKAIEAELDTGLKNPKRPFRILKVTVDKKYKFGRVAIVNPISGKEE